MANRACGGCYVCDVPGERSCWPFVSCLSASAGPCCTCLPNSASPANRSQQVPAITPEQLIKSGVPDTGLQHAEIPDSAALANAPLQQLPKTTPEQLIESGVPATGLRQQAPEIVEAGVLHPPIPTPLAKALQQLPEISLEQLDAIIPIIAQEVDRLDPRSSSASISKSLSNTLAQWGEHEQICTSFIDSLPTAVIDEVAGNGGRLFMSLLTNVLSGMGGVRFLGLGFTFIAWSLDNMSKISQNRADCIDILRRSLQLLRNTKEIWEATNIPNPTQKNDVLHDSVEKALRCTIFCASNLTEGWILRILKVATLKDAITTFAVELDRANQQNIEFMLIYGLKSKMQRQITYPISYDEIVGGRDVIEEAVTYLKTSSDDVMAICLYGMGGIGKTFLGDKIFSQFQRITSYRHCRVELPLEEQQWKVCDIQAEIVRIVSDHHRTLRFRNVSDGILHMQRELELIKDHPIFLYVDNVQEPEVLAKLLPKASHFPNGSRILITSRGVHIEPGIVELSIKRRKLIEVMKLENPQAQQLLQENLKYTEGQHRENSEVELELEKRVLELCDGLPLGLIVVGGYINANENGLKNVEVWRQVVDAMEKAQPLGGGKSDRLYYRLMFSITSLDQIDKQAFLDVVFCVGIRASWASTERLVGPTSLNNLCQRGLVRKREKSLNSCVSTPGIHDVLKAMGNRMVKDDKDELRIMSTAERSNLKKQYKNTPAKVVALNDVTVEAHLLEKMTQLRLLRNVDVQGEAQEIELSYLKVVRGLRCSTTTILDWSACACLKEIEWGYPDGGAPNATDLEVFKHKTISTGLEVLKLSDWNQLKHVHVIETLTCLKVLRLQSCEEIESLPEGISRLKGLTHLGLLGCSKLKRLPEGISRLKCLEVLDLGICESLESVPDGLTRLTGLTELYLYECKSLQSIPEGIGNLRGVTHFTLRGCEMLQSIPEGATELMSGLTELSLARCSRIEQLPEGITRLSGLRRLDLGGCRSLRSLPEGMSALTGLTSLGLSYCRRLRAIPEDIARLTGLTELDLTHCSALQALPKEVSGLTTLRILLS